MIYPSYKSFANTHFLNRQRFLSNTLFFGYYEMYELFMNYVSDIQCLKYFFNFKSKNKLLSNTVMSDLKSLPSPKSIVSVCECENYDDIVKPDIEKVQVPFDEKVIVDEDITIGNIATDSETICESETVFTENVFVENVNVQFPVSDIEEVIVSESDLVKDNIIDKNLFIDKHPFKFTNKTIKKAIKKYFSSSNEQRVKALIEYGHISTWDVSGVTNMSKLFYGMVLISDISGWNVSNVVDFSYMFQDAKIHNVSLKNWNVEKALSMYSMFEGATFDNDTIEIENWKLNGNVDLRRAFYNSSLLLNLCFWNFGKSLVSQMFSHSKLAKSDVETWDNESIVEKIHFAFQK